VTALLAQIGGHATPPDLPLAVKPGERALDVMRRVGLFEPLGWRPLGWAFHRRQCPDRRHPQVASRRPVKGPLRPRPEEPTVIDTGDATITDRRIVFQGSKQVREWRLAELLGFTYDDHRCATAIQVSNRQKVSGLAYQGIDLEHVHLAMAVAAAIAEGHEAVAVAPAHDAPGSPVRPTVPPSGVAFGQASPSSPPRPASRLRPGPAPRRCSPTGVGTRPRPPTPVPLLGRRHVDTPCRGQRRHRARPAVRGCVARR
jgi:hypothetical protein